MKTFALKRGDLVLSGSQLGMVEGAARTQQQVGLALRESYGVDRFHPGWGSVLPSWIGRVITPDVRQEVQVEVQRVVRNVITNQNAMIQRRITRGLSPVVGPNEIIVGMESVDVIQDQDTLAVRLVVNTAGSATLTVVASPEGTANANS